MVNHKSCELTTATLGILKHLMITVQSPDCPWQSTRSLACGADWPAHFNNGFWLIVMYPSIITARVYCRILLWLLKVSFSSTHPLFHESLLAEFIT